MRAEGGRSEGRRNRDCLRPGNATDWQAAFNVTRFLAIFLLLAGMGVADTPTDRPTNWAQPAAEGALGNFYRISDELYRAKQPTAADIPELKRVGIKTVLSLRHHHRDSQEFERAQIKALQYEMDAGRVSVDGLIKALRLIRAAPKPVLVHCWHGSDRTGFVVAGYRMVCMNWTAEQAIDELRRGGFGYHEFFYPNVARVLRELNVAEVRKAVLADDGGAAVGAKPAGKN